ncbi:hypothetical protein ACWJKU_07170 [Methylocaldum sp. MU1018]
MVPTVSISAPRHGKTRAGFWPIRPFCVRCIPMALAMALSAGCATDSARLTELSDLELCRGYGAYAAWSVAGSVAERYKHEIERRKLVTPEEWALASQKRIQKGMSRCALYASWGVPMSEQPLDREGDEIRHIYHSGWLMSPGAVYTKNGRVEGWGY